MLFLPEPAAADLEAYYTAIEEKILRELNKKTTDKLIKHIMTKQVIKNIICGKPEKLVDYHDMLMRDLVVSYDPGEYMLYSELKKDKKHTKKERKIIHRYRITEKLIEIFDYEKHISSSKTLSYMLAKQLNRNTCTYCNRLYTTTVIVTDPKTKRINDSGRITRPQFDHWFAKSIYPTLSLSYYNLIPSCSVCNSSVKGDTVFGRGTHIHPYEPLTKEYFSFTYTYTSPTDISVDLDFKGNQKIERTLIDLRIKEIYNGHSYLELKDLHDLRNKYTDNYLETLLNAFDSLEVGKKEAYRLIFGTEHDEQDFHKRPFSKFKKDILTELGVKL